MIYLIELIFLLKFLAFIRFAQCSIFSEIIFEDCSSGQKEFFNDGVYFCDPDGTLLSASDGARLNEELASAHASSCSIFTYCGCGFEIFFVVLSSKDAREGEDLDSRASKFGSNLGLKDCFLVVFFNKTSYELGLSHSHEAREFLSPECYTLLREPLIKERPLRDILFQRAGQYKSIMTDCNDKTLLAEASLKTKAVVPIIIIFTIVCIVIIFIAVVKFCKGSQFRPVNSMLTS